MTETEETHRIVQSDDGSYTAYSTHFDEHYHSTKDGALTESLQKHVIPAFTLQHDKETLTILDICFGLGFNTLSTLYYLHAQGLKKKIRIFSPEFDETLVQSLGAFPYPEPFERFRPIIQTLSSAHYYRDDDVEITLYVGDAREYLKTCTEAFDIVYQDAFSPAVNPALWTYEYFTDVVRCMKDDAVLTTYSTALKTRLALYRNGLNVFLNEGEGYRNATVASRREKLDGYAPVDMEHKIVCNPGVEPLRDGDL